MNLRKAVDNLLIYDPAFVGYANKFVGQAGGSSAIAPVKSMDDLKTVIDSFTNIKFLEIALHGSPGMIHFANKGAMLGAFLGNLTQGRPFIQKDVRILFDSCNIGEGAAGDNFMDALAKLMLIGKGGIIGASTVKNIVWRSDQPSASDVYLNIENLSDIFGAKLKVRRYDVNGSLINQLSVNRFGG